MFSKLTALLVAYFTAASFATPVHTQQAGSPARIARGFLPGSSGGIVSGGTLGTAGGVVGGLGGEALGSTLGQQGGQALGNALGTAETAIEGVTGGGILHGL